MSETTTDPFRAMVECPECGGPRRDTGGKALEYHHRDDCPKLSRSRALFAGLTAPDPTAPAAYRLWPADMPFRRNGTPVVGSMGTSVRRVVIMDAETFHRLVREHPSLAIAHFEVATL